MLSYHWGTSGFHSRGRRVCLAVCNIAKGERMNCWLQVLVLFSLSGDISSLAVCHFAMMSAGAVGCMCFQLMCTH